MPGIDLAVWLALVLSLASALLCVAYGLTHWNHDDDAGSPSSSEGTGRGGGPPEAP